MTGIKAGCQYQVPTSKVEWEGRGGGGGRESEQQKKKYEKNS